MGKISRYLQERVKWKKFGKPIRTDEQIEDLYNICQSCDQFKATGKDIGECSKCGCYIKKIGTWLNKLAWGTTRCPLDDPKWIESKPRFMKNILITQEDLVSAEQDHDGELKSHETNTDPPCGCK